MLLQQPHAGRLATVSCIFNFWIIEYGVIVFTCNVLVYIFLFISWGNSLMCFLWSMNHVEAVWMFTSLKTRVMLFRGHTLNEHVPMVKLFSIFPRGTITLVQHRFMSLFIFSIINPNHNSKPMSNFHWLNVITFLFLYSYFYYFISVINGQIPTFLSMFVHIWSTRESLFLLPRFMPTICCDMVVKHGVLTVRRDVRQV